MRDRLSKYYKNTTVGDLLSSIINSYSQVFFSKNRIFAVILFIVSFFDVYAGIAGLLAIIISNLFAWFLGTKRQNIIDGTYGFNALMVGLGIGIYYQPGIEFYILLLVVSLLSFCLVSGLF